MLLYFLRTLLDHLLIELVLHLSHVKQIYSPSIHITHEWIVYIQITKGGVDFSGDFTVKSSRWHQVLKMQPSDHIRPQCHVVIYGRNFDFIAHSKQLGITLLATFLLSSRFKLPYTRSLGIVKKQTLVCNLQVSRALKSCLWTITVFKNNTSYCNVSRPQLAKQSSTTTLKQWGSHHRLGGSTDPG